MDACWAAGPDPRRTGSFFTPDALVDHLVRRCVPATGAPRVLDPACGAGAFLGGVARHNPRAVRIGFDIDAAALASAGRDHPGATLLTADFLAEGAGPPGGLLDAVVGNPPYVRARRLPAARRDDLRRRFAWADGQFDLAAPFLERSLAWLRPGGRLGFVLPNKVLVAAYAGRLRAALTRDHALVEVVDLAAEEGAFGGACAYPVLVVVERRPAAPGDAVLLARGALRGGRVVVGPARRVPLRDWLPGGPAEADDAAAEVFGRRDLPRFADLATAREAVHTGNVRSKLVVVPAPGTGGRTGPGARLLRGRDVRRWRAEWAGLRLLEDVRPDRAAGEYARVPPPEFFEAPKVLLREIALRPTAAYDDDGLRCLNKAYVVRTLARPSPDRLLALTAVLNSAPFGRLFRARYAAGGLRGGHLQFKPQWLSQVPMPDLDAAVAAGLAGLARACAAGAPLDDAVDRVCWGLYGWPEEAAAATRAA